MDLYEKGISVSSMSKVFSLAGIRLGWIASRDPEAVSYTHLTCSGRRSRYSRQIPSRKAGWPKMSP